MEDQVLDGGQGRVFARLSHTHGDHARFVDRAGEHLVAHGLLHRDRFAGDVGLVDGRHAGFHHAVGGDVVAGADHHAFVGHQRSGIDFGLGLAALPVTHQLVSAGGGDAHERFDFLPGADGGALLQQLGQQHEKGDARGGDVVADSEGEQQRDCHQLVGGGVVVAVAAVMRLLGAVVVRVVECAFGQGVGPALVVFHAQTFFQAHRQQRLDRRPHDGHTHEHGGDGREQLAGEAALDEHVGQQGREQHRAADQRGGDPGVHPATLLAGLPRGFFSVEGGGDGGQHLGHPGRLLRRTGHEAMRGIRRDGEAGLPPEESVGPSHVD